MAHALTTRSNGFVEFAFLKSDGAAWHGLGQPMADDATLEQWLASSGMDWRIQRGKVRYAVDAAGTLQEMPEQHVLFRSDTKAPLGLVSDSYKAVQPRQVLEFFKSVAGLEGLDLTAAGTLFDGKRFWATAKIGEACPVSDRDKIGGYLLLSTSADGSMATEARLTTIRVVCNNTLQMARGEGKAQVRLTHRSVFRPEEIHRQLGTLKARDTFAAFQQQMAQLAECRIAYDAADDLVVRLLAGGAQQIVEGKGAEADKVRESIGYRKIMGLFGGEQLGAGLPGVHGTAYGMLQAVTEYADHHIRARSADNRFAAAQWGSGAELKASAFEQLLAMS